MKKALIFILIVAVISVCYFIYKASTFNVFDVEITKVAEVKVPNKSYEIGVFYLPSNASSQSYIQVKQLSNSEEKILESFERYNFVNDYKIFNDTLQLIVSDTSFLERKVDTLFLKLP